MRYETNLSTGEVTEHGDAPATPEAQVYAVEAQAAVLRGQL